MKKIISIISILLTFSLISYADHETGNSLLSKLSYNIMETSEEEIDMALDYSLALGYVTGVFDVGNNVLYEAPQGVKTLQVIDVAKNYFNNHPETRHEGAINLLFEAFKEAFPKKKKGDEKERLK